MLNVARSIRPVTIVARDLAGKARIVYAGRDAVEMERQTAKALKAGWTILQTVKHVPNACASLAGLARPAAPGRRVALPLCAARGKDREDRSLFDYVMRLATQ